jgi:hypothetical protein
MARLFVKNATLKNNMSRYQNSECRRNMLHDFKILEQDHRGLIERCKRCGLKMSFPNNVPSHVYLSYHTRQALQENDPRFYIEYPHAR